jgi:hypothetical protein
MRELTFMEIEEVGGADGWDWITSALGSVEQTVIQWGQSFGAWLNSYAPGGTHSSVLSAPQIYELLDKCVAAGGSVNVQTGAGTIGVTVQGKSVTVGIQVNGETITCTQTANP